MLTHSNIDRPDSKQVSKAPFTYTSTLRLGNNEIPTGSIISIKLYVEDSTKVPYRFYSIRPDGVVLFCDKTGTPLIQWQTFAETETPQVREDLPYISSLLYNMNGVIAGHIVCTYDVISVIRGVIDSISEQLLIPADAFVLLPQCHIAMLKGQCKSFGLINNNETLYTTGNLNISVNTEADCVLPVAGDTICFNMANTAETIQKMAPKNGLCGIRIGDTTYCCADSNIILKAGVLSNLRVTKETKKLVLKGVRDA